MAALYFFTTPFFRTEPGIAWTLFLVISVASGVRFILARAQHAFYPAHRKAWMRLFRLLTLATALGWGAAAGASITVFGIHHPATLLAFVGIGGIAAAASILLAPDVWTAYGFVLATLGYPVWALVRSGIQTPGQTEIWGLLALLAIELAILSSNVRQLSQQFWEVLRLRSRVIDEHARAMKAELAITEAAKLAHLGEMTEEIAHEIKNPLTSIKTFAEYLPKKYDDPGFREKFSRIVVDEVDRVNNIVKQLLEFSKPKELELRSESITGILDDTLGLLNNNLIQNKIEVVKNYKDSPVLPVDKNQLKQAFLNLFLNSIQAMPNGGTLTVSVLLSSDLCSLITISDTGSGIPKDQLDHVFDPFFSTKESGTGLGLSIVHGIITKHGGKISVESVVGGGTTIRATLKNQS
jgi:signal transduction histidine kinase